MKARLTAREVALVALRIEENGLRFYERCAAESTDPSATELFTSLATEERAHHATFEAMAEQLDASETLGFPGEEELFVRALADESMFPARRTGELLPGGAAPTATDVIDLALKMEHDAIRFYEGLARLLPRSDSEKLHLIVEEERTHVTMLESVRAKLAEPTS